MKTLFVLATSVVLLIQPVSAFAVVIEEQLTPAFIKRNPHKFSVTARKQDDGSLQWTIVRMLDRPTYMVARFQVRRQGKLVAESAHPFYALDQRETFHLAASADHIEESVFELSERSFGDADGQKVPLPGGIDYVLRLKDFRPATTAQAAPGSD